VGVRSTPSCDSSDTILSTHRATNVPGSRNVILLRKPSDARIGRFLDDQRSLSFSYPEVGASREWAPPDTFSTTTGDGWGRDTRRSRER
jgi:hypothetical protein